MLSTCAKEPPPAPIVVISIIGVLVFVGLTAHDTQQIKLIYAESDGRETATAVISALAGLHGAWGVRVHDVRASVDAVKVVGAWQREIEDTDD